MTVRDQYDTSWRLKYDHRGSSMISTGIAGTPDQSYSPKTASRTFVKTLASGGPPRSRTKRRAAAIAGSSGDTPETFMAKYALMVADRFPGPPSYRPNAPSARCTRRR